MINKFIIDEIEKILLKKEQIISEKKLSKIKRTASKKFGKPCPTNIEILAKYREMLGNSKITKNELIEKTLVTKGIRTDSGVAVIAILTKPYSCPGNCAYCPKEKNMPKSYLSNEPAVMRAILTKFHPYEQVRARIKSLETTGHNTEKLEIIVMGGTFSYFPKNYQNWFIKECFRACNEFDEKENKYKKLNLEQQQKKNEKAKKRVVGLTLETRPDYISEKEIIQMRKLGATRVELGVQSVYEDVLKLNKRGHGVKETINATKLLKEAGFKINYHIMPELPGSSPQKDVEMFKILFSDPNFKPDMLKIYPCVVVKNSEIYSWLKKGKYTPYTDKQRLIVLSEIKKNLPYYVRVTRLIRDIPSTSIIEGNKMTNLRQTLKRIGDEENWQCKCIRCREVRRNKKINEDELELFREDYEASEGKEIFLSFEDKKRKYLYSILRLRINGEESSQKHFLPELKEAAIIRELHTYGQLVSLKKKNEKSPQHIGLGKKLLKEAERISREEFGIKKIAIISGIGVREYYRKQGYKKEGSYMTKKI